MFIEAIVVFGLLFLWWRFKSFDRAQVLHNPKDDKENLTARWLHRIKILRQLYYFPVWSFDGNVHSLYGNWIRQAPKQKYFREDLFAADGQIISLDWTLEELSDDAPLVFILPGINGGAYNEYSQYFVKFFREEGWRVAVYNRPGAAGTKLVNSQVVQFPDSQYVTMLFDHIMKRYPQAPLFAVGISLGGNSLLRYLGQQGEAIRGRVSGAISFSNPFDFLQTIQHIRSIKFYDSWFCKKGVSLVRNNSEIMKKDPSLDLEEIFRAKKSSEFDQAYTMKIYSMSDMQELDTFYHTQSCINFLHDIRVPTLIINAYDDPLIGNSFLKDVSRHVSLNSDISLITTKHGGHGCWFEGFIVPSSKTWMDRLCIEAIHAMLALRTAL